MMARWNVSHAGKKYQMETIIEAVPADVVPVDYVLQVQTIMLVTERQWCDFVSYSNGMHMATVRAYPDATIQTAIVEAAAAFEKRLAEKMSVYHAALASKARLIPTERRIIGQDMHL